MEIQEKEEIARLTCEALNEISGEIINLSVLNDDVEYAYKKNMLIRERFGIRKLYNKLKIFYRIPFDIEQRDENNIKRFSYAKCN